MQSRFVEQIENCLTTAESQLSQHAPKIIDDHPKLKKYIINQELIDEIAALRGALQNHPDSFIEFFKDRCEKRAETNNESALSFMAYSEGACNKMFVDIATLLFQPRTLGELISLVMPNFKAVVQAEPRTTSASSLFPSNSNEPGIFLNEHRLSLLRQAPTQDELSHFIGAGQYLFDVRRIATFSFKRHHQLHSLITQHYPDLAQRLYQHNGALRTLEQQMLMLTGAGKTPLAMSHTLALDFFENHTNDENLKSVIRDFIHFWDLLPQAFKSDLTVLSDGAIDAALMKMRKNNVDNLDITIMMFFEILSNPLYASLLNTAPRLSEEETAALHHQSHPRTFLSTEINNKTLTCPTHYIAASLSQLTLQSSLDYLSLFLSIPTTLYTTQLQSANLKQNHESILPMELAELMKRSYLDTSIEQAIYQALIDNIERVGGIKELLIFAVICGIEFTQTVLSMLPASERKSALTEPVIDDGVSVLDIAAARNASTFRYLLNLFEPDERLAVVTKKIGRDTTVLEEAAGSSEASLDVIFELLPPAHHFTIAEHAGKKGYPLLYYAASRSRSLNKALQFYPDEDTRAAAVKREYEDGSTLLHRIVENWIMVGPADLAAFQRALDFYAPEEQLLALSKKDHKGRDVFQHALDSPEVAIYILSLYPKNDRLDKIINSTSYFGENILQDNVRNRYFSSALSLLSDTDIPVAITCKTEKNENLFFLSYNAPESFELIWNAYPQDKRIEALLEENTNHECALHKILTHTETTAKLFELISDPNDFHRLFSFVSSIGVTALHAAAGNPASLERVMSRYSPEELTTQLRIQDEYGRTIFDFAVAHVDALKRVASLFQDPKELLTLILKLNCMKRSALMSAARNAESMTFIVELLKANEETFSEIQKENSNSSLTFRRMLYGCALQSNIFGVFLAGLGEKEEEKFEMDVQRAPVHVSEAASSSQVEAVDEVPRPARKMRF